MPEYFGIVDRDSKNIDPEVKRAVTSYYCQKARCQCTGHNRYRTTGGKGVELQYTLREYVTWWLHEIKKKHHWKSPTCGRLDHDDHYRFGNIIMQERAENTRERLRRIPDARTPVERHFPDGTVLKFNSVGEAARVTGIFESLIWSELEGRISKRNGKPFFRKAKGGQ